MNKLKHWCNQNSGFIAFWGIIIMIIVWIIPPINIEFPRLINVVKQVLLFKLTIPIYGILIFVILLIIILGNKIRTWNRLFFKSVAQKIIDIPSDENNIFLESPTYKDLPKNTPVHVYKDGGYWNRYKQFHELSNAYWIAHTKMINDEEAIKGGTYIIERRLKIEYSLNRIESAFVYMTIDDFCRLTVNDNYVGEFSGIDKLNQIPIKEHLLKGENILRFELINSIGGSLSAPGYKANIGKKGELNPYAIRYLIRIINK